MSVTLTQTYEVDVDSETVDSLKAAEDLITHEIAKTDSYLENLNQVQYYELSDQEIYVNWSEEAEVA